MRILETGQGLFGPIYICDEFGARSLRLNYQVQGGCYFVPTILGMHPGPVAISKYVNGWLMAGTQQPEGTTIGMVGLGSGAGVVALLFNFPHLSIKVIEIDPVVIRLAFKCFPLLEHYTNEGRLDVIIGDATKVSLDYDVIFLDAYTGVNDPIHTPELLSKPLWFNCISSHKLAPEFASFKHFDVAPELHPSMLRNMILTNQPIDRQKLDDFTPYEGLESPEVDELRTHYFTMIGNN